MRWTVAALPNRALLAAARRLEPPIDRLLRFRPIRQRLHTAAVQAWRKTDDPLVLCFGNINRSPLAAAVARRRTGSFANSSGFYPTTGRAPPDRAILRAATYGVDLSGHRSTRVDQAALGRATAIFIFDLDNLVRIALTRPEAIRRTYFVGALPDTGPVFIQDPHGVDDATMYAVQDRIVAAIEAGDTGRT
jgi:protein-tyrosine-phosphatase